jgi:hypothetical protein
MVELTFVEPRRLEWREAREARLEGELMAAGRFATELVTSQLVAWDDAADALAEHTAKLVVTR